MVLHYVFQEHKTVIQQVARNLAVTIYPSPNDDDPPGVEYVPDAIK